MQQFNKIGIAALMFLAGTALPIVAQEGVETEDVAEATAAPKRKAKQEKKYPTIVKAIQKENGGHGSGVMAGIHNASGLFFKVVDSDDWV